MIEAVSWYFKKFVPTMFLAGFERTLYGDELRTLKKRLFAGDFFTALNVGERRLVGPEGLEPPTRPL